MIALDTNVVVRILVADDARQTRRARQLLERCRERKEPVLLSNPALCEVEWVLEGVYGASRQDVASAIQELLTSEPFVFENANAVEQALHLYRRKKGEFSDHLIGVVGNVAGARTTFTFDRDLRSTETFTLLTD